MFPRLGRIVAALVAAPPRLPHVDPLQGVTDHSRDEDQATGQVERGVVASGRVHEGA